MDRADGREGLDGRERPDGKEGDEPVPAPMGERPDGKEGDEPVPAPMGERPDGKEGDEPVPAPMGERPDGPDGKEGDEPVPAPMTVPHVVVAKDEGSASRFPLLRGKNGQYFLALLVLGLIVRFVPAYLFYGSNDVGAWRLAIRDFHQGINPYTTGKLNWPPLWPTLLLYTGRMETVYNLPDYVAVKVFPILADVSIGLAIYFWFVVEWRDGRKAFRRALWYILNPVAIGNCAMHGQFDALPVLFTVLAVMAATRAGERLSPAAGIWLSLGVLAKTWPLIFVPLFASRIRSPLGKVGFILLATAPTAVSVAILYRTAPEPVSKFVLNYRGGSAPYGLTIPRYFLDRQTQAQANAEEPSGSDNPPPVGAANSGSISRSNRRSRPAGAGAQQGSSRAVADGNHPVTEPETAGKRAGLALATAVRLLLYGVWIASYLLLWKRGSLIHGVCLLLLDFFVFSATVGIQYFVWIVGPAVLGDFKRMRLYTIIASLCIGITYVFSPFDGERFAFLARIRPHEFYLHNLNPHHQLINLLLGIPLWAYFVWWWITLWRDTLAGRPSADSQLATQI